ncbi:MULTISPECIES: hypothetical protein [Acinetobacter calcoaceticus/baumannii complex]|nr:MULTISPECIES: hypothetical protein [Acinetobacter calcoaceticus/baumannii complex]MDK2129552.1 hypothetical protein [Acinetobacter baumannii]MDK2160244.1 hypothetical protein [Acinetobacter baumannii]MDK2167703.1 hypothetical protein [Acinetobacter baumannii]MDK2251280.1 hypothetical protein [Acinetobacter baumannii]MDK2262485.1 hypothetical protein [Acinetobacter baumannii]
MKELSMAIVTCGFIAGSLNTTGLPEFLYVLFAILTACSNHLKG